MLAPCEIDPGLRRQTLDPIPVGHGRLQAAVEDYDFIAAAWPRDGWRAPQYRSGGAFDPLETASLRRCGGPSPQRAEAPATGSERAPSQGGIVTGRQTKASRCWRAISPPCAWPGREPRGGIDSIAAATSSWNHGGHQRVRQGKAESWGSAVSSSSRSSSAWAASMRSKGSRWGWL